MNCLTIEQIYSYLEGDLPASEVPETEAHLAFCSKCREAVEERRILTQAAESLPDLEVPPDFAEKVMSRVFRAKTAFWTWLAATAAGLGSLVLLLWASLSGAGEGAPGFLISFSRTLWSFAENAVLLFAKFMTLVALAFKTIQQLAKILLKWLSLLSSLISPEIQILSIGITLLTIIALLFGTRKRFLIGEKS